MEDENKLEPTIAVIGEEEKKEKENEKKKPLTIDMNDLRGSGNDEPVAKIVVVPSNRNQRKRMRMAEIKAAQNENNNDTDFASSASASGASEDLSSKNDRDLELIIQKMSRNVDVLGPKLKDGGAKYKTILKLYKDEFERRNHNNDNSCASEDLSSKNDRDLELIIQRLSRIVDVLGPKLKDGGAKYKTKLKLYKDEFERRKLRRAQQVANGCKTPVDNGSPINNASASEDLSSKNDRDLELIIQMLSKNVDVLGPKLKDGAAKYKTKLKLYNDEFERRKLLRAQQNTGIPSTFH